jgi:hypothetical protein
MDAFTIIVFLVLLAFCIGILGAVHDARGSSSEAEADLELGETRRAVRHEKSPDGWLMLARGYHYRCTVRRSGWVHLRRIRMRFSRAIWGSL